MSSNKTKVIPCSNYTNPLCILYGSATGNSEHIAKDLTKSIQSNISILHPTFDSVICCELDQYKKVGCLSLWESDIHDDTDTNDESISSSSFLKYQYRGVLIICSTTGNGDPPENASRFVRHMKKAATTANHTTTTTDSSLTLQQHLLFRNVYYAVLGLGDTNYDQYCAAAVTIDRVIHQLGGHKCILYDKKPNSALTCADEGSGQLEDVVEPWVKNIVSKMVQACQKQQCTTTTIPRSVVVEETKTTIEDDSNTTTAITTIPTKEIDPAEDNMNSNLNGESNGVTPLVVKKDDDTISKDIFISSNGFISSDSSSNMPNNGTITTDVGPPISFEESHNHETQVPIGVQMIQTILAQENELQLTAIDVVDVDPSTLPASLLNDEMTTTTMKPFTYIAAVDSETIDENEVYVDPVTGNNSVDDVQQRVRGLSIGSHNNNNNPHGAMVVVDDSVSSVSAGYYYTIVNPYPAQILRARYLTNTSITTATQEVLMMKQYQQQQDHHTTTTLEDSETMKYASFLKDAERIYDAEFPLTLSSSSSSSSSSQTSDIKDDAAVIERNAKRVIEMTLSLPDDATLEYSPGDSLGILVDNPISSVGYVANMLQKNDPMIHDPYQQMIQINHEHMILHRVKPITVINAIARNLDLCSVIKNKRILYSLSQLATDSLEQKYLQLLSSKTPRGETLFRCIIDEQRMTIVDILQLFPSIQSNMTLEILFQIVPNSIPPRYYSVSSSPLQRLHITNTSSNGEKHNNTAHTNYLTIAFSVVDYTTPSLTIDSAIKDLGQRRVRGVATRYLEAISSSLLCHNTSENSIRDVPKVRIFPKPTIDFRMPHSLSTPLILIGPGTGIAPFIGFLRHRQALIRQQSNNGNTNGDINDSENIYSTATAAKTVVEGTWRGGYELENDNELAISQQDESGLNVGADYRMQSNHSFNYGNVDVFFGCRNKNHDWLYKDEMNEFLKDGIISKLYTAFSRDEPSDKNNRRYVQDFILNDKDCGKRLIDLIVNQDAAVYVCGDGNSMALDVQNAFIFLFASSQFNGNHELGKAYLDDMKRKQRFLMDIWS